MKKTYDFFRKFSWMFILGAVLNIIFGTVAFGLDYVNEQFAFPRVSAILFFVFLISSLAFAVFFAYKSQHLRISKIRNQSSSFFKIASWLACSISLFFFLFELLRLFVTVKGAIINPSSFNFPRVARLILFLPLSAYFFFEAFPTKIRKTKIVIPNFVRYILAVCAILWGVVSIFTVYFYQNLSTTNMLKNWHLIYYLVITFFLLFETKFKYVSQKGFGYVLSCAALFIIGVSFSITTILALSFGFLPLDYSQSFTEIEYVSAFIFGLYAFARLQAIKKTMKHVMDNSDKGSFSSKFKKTPDDFATESAAQENEQK